MGAEKGTVGQGHDDGEAQSCGDVEDFHHEGEALGSGGGHNPSARGRGANARGKRGVLALHGDKLRAYHPFVYVLRVILGDLRLGRNRVNRHHIGLDLPHRLSYRFVSGYGLAHSPPLSGTISMASLGQIAAQTPQPLQCS
jgi:hypothetical protein